MMGNAKETPTDLQERFLQYLRQERELEVERRRSADVQRLEASKRIRAIDKQIESIKGGAL